MKEIKYNKLDEIIYYDKCLNGLDVYLWVNPRVNNYYATLNVKYGSVHTDFKIKNKKYNVPDGIAHFLEHIKFNEKNGKTAQDFFNKYGSSINAFTTFEYTSYEVYGTNSIIDNVLHLLEYVQTPVINKELIDKERGIINEEIAMGKNNPARNLYYATNKVLFHKMKHFNEIAGTQEDIKKINTENLNLVYNTFYHPSNMFLVVTGNFNPYELMAAIKEQQNNMKFNDYLNPKITKANEDVSVVKENEIIEDNVQIPKISINYKMSRKDFKTIKDDKILMMGLRIIMKANFGATSDFKEDLMEKKLITYMGTGVRKIDDIIVINISCETRYPTEIKEIIDNNMHNLLVNQKILDRRIKTFIASLITSFDDIESINSQICTDVLYYKKPINNAYNLYKSIKLDDINNIIKHIKLDNKAIITQVERK